MRQVGESTRKGRRGVRLDTRSDDLVQRLVRKTFPLSPQQHRLYDPWLLQIQTHTLFKVAMLVALSESLELKLTKMHLEVSLELLDKLEKNLSKVFEGMGRNELAPVAARIVDMLEMVGQPINEKKVVADFFKDADTREIYGILAHLHSTGKIV